MDREIKLMEALTSISNMCVGDIAMGYTLDAGEIGNLIFEATGMTNPQLNNFMREVETPELLNKDN